MNISSRNPGENARAYAVRVILQNIIDLTLPPGSAISENELSFLFSLSRTPVREALIELSKLGLVEIRPQKGSYVSKIDYDRIEESRFMRLVLENAVLDLACKEDSPNFPMYLERLKQNIKAQKDCSSQNDIPAFIQLDNRFHQLIFESAGKSWTYEIIHGQMVHFDRLRSLSLRSVGHERTIRDHEDILYAMERRDSELAQMLMTRHLGRHQMDRKELITLYPDYFIS